MDTLYNDTFYKILFIIFLSGGWSFNGIPSVLDKMATSCVKLQGLGLSGLKGLTLENIKFLISNCPYIERLDLSGINVSLRLCGIVVFYFMYKL